MKKKSPVIRSLKASIASVLLTSNASPLLAQENDNQLTINSAFFASSGSELGAAREEGELAQLFKLQKALVYQILQQSGIDPTQLSPKIKASIDELSTKDLEAFYAFSRCLDHVDREEYEIARIECQKAVEQDPSFELAKQLLASLPFGYKNVAKIAEESMLSAQSEEYASLAEFAAFEPLQDPTETTAATVPQPDSPERLPNEASAPKDILIRDQLGEAEQFGLTVAGTDPDSTPDSTPDPVPNPDSDTDPSSDPDTDPTSDPDTDPSSDPDTDPSSDPDTDPSSDPDTDPSSDPDTDPSSDPDTDPSSDPDTDPSSDPDTDPSSDPDTDPSSDPDTDPSSDPDTDPNSDPDSEPDPLPDPTPDPDSVPDPTPDPDPVPDPTPDPDPVPDPTPDPDPIPDPTPDPDPIPDPTPDPDPVPDPTPDPDPVPDPTPDPDPAPDPTPDPDPVPDPTPDPDPVPDPTPDPDPVPDPTPDPDPVPDPTPDPDPVPDPTPDPDPVPDPTPDPDPVPDPTPDPDPVPDPTPDPDPVPDPTPDPDPVPDPTPDPDPVPDPTPDPDPVPDPTPDPDPVPDPTPDPDPVPDPTPDPDTVPDPTPDPDPVPDPTPVVKKGIHSAYLMRKVTTADGNPSWQIVRNPYQNVQNGGRAQETSDALINGQTTDLFQDDPLITSLTSTSKLTFEVDDSKLMLLVNFEEGRSGDQSDSIEIPLRRVVTESQAFPSLEIGYYEPDPAFNNWKSTNGNEYRFLESRFSFAEGFVTPQDKIADLAADQSVFDYQGLAGGEIYFNGIESSCGTCGKFQGTIDFGKGQARDFRINFDTGRAFANIQTREATLNSDGSFTFTDQQGSYSIGGGNSDPVTTSGVVDGAVFGKDAESVGGTVNLNGSPLGPDAYATGRFGGKR